MHICQEYKECPISSECSHGEPHEKNEECGILCPASFNQDAECEEI